MMLCRPGILILLSVALLGTVALAEEQEDADKKLRDQLLAVYHEHAASYKIELGSEGTELSLQAKPVFAWLNPARVATPRLQHGAVFVWTHEGRAEVIGTVFSQTKGQQDPVMFHEFHSLATASIKATNQKGIHWDIREGGVAPKPFPDAVQPAANRRLRMLQMRRMADRFSGYSINYDEKRWSLELQRRPIHRMADGHPKILDGAVFTLVSASAGTDPEVMIVLEARKIDGQWKWHYSVCRFTDLKTWVSLDKEVVWSFENGTDGPYIDSGINDRYRFSHEGTIELSAGE
jgi:hypothetical protein